MKLDISLRFALLLATLVTIATADAWMPAWHAILRPSVQVTSHVCTSPTLRF